MKMQAGDKCFLKLTERWKSLTGW